MMFEYAELTPQQDPGDYGGKDVARRLTDPDSVQPEEVREDQQHGDEEYELAGKCQEDGFFRHSNAVEEAGCDHLETDDGGTYHHNPQTVYRLTDQLFVIREHDRNGSWTEFAQEESDTHGHSRPQNGDFQYLCYAWIELCTIVVSCNRLHALDQSDDEHAEDEGKARHDAVCADSHITAVTTQSVVDDNYDNARGNVH